MVLLLLNNLYSVFTPIIIGNCFGDEGIDLIRDTMNAKGHSDEVLGSFSDDEGNSEDEDESYHDNDDPSLNFNDEQTNVVCTS